MKTPLSSAQRRILQYLKRAGISTAKQIAKSQGVTPMAVRHHLMVLEKAGLILSSLERHHTGRPSYLYSLSDKAQAAFPNEYAQLADRVLHAITGLVGQPKVARVFAQITRNTVARFAPRVLGRNFEERVAEMARIQSEAGYMAEWRRLDDKKCELTERNCAILQVAQHHPEACDCEISVMRELVGAMVTRMEHIASGGPYCRFLIQQNPRSAAKKGRGAPC
jgi:predicted ArsR family transcriptional regulator